MDEDECDAGKLVYSVSGDGVDDLAPSDAYFSVDPYTGTLHQLRVSRGGMLREKRKKGKRMAG